MRGRGIFPRTGSSLDVRSLRAPEPFGHARLIDRTKSESCSRICRSALLLKSSAGDQRAVEENVACAIWPLVWVSSTCFTWTLADGSRFFLRFWLFSGTAAQINSSGWTLYYLLKTASEDGSYVFNVYFIRLASSLINIISDVVSLFICVLIICSKYSYLLRRETMKMIFLRKFRFLILMVFLIACSMHIMIDLLPKLERQGSSGCSCSHTPDENPQSWGKQSRPNKHTLRILQDFSNEPSSNGSSHSLERVAVPGDKTQALSGTEHHGQRGEKKRQFIQDAAVTKKIPVKGSKLSALFDHPLYKRVLPPLSDEDTLFNVNTDIRFDPKAAEDQGW